MLRILPQVIEPESWVLAFHRTAARRWTGWLACGTYKHVSAFTWVDPLKLWLVYDVTLSGTRLILLPDAESSTRRIANETADADLVRMAVRTIIPKNIPKASGLAPFYCVPAIKHLIGLRSGALRPDALWRECMRHGGVIIHGRGEAAATEPGNLGAAGAGQGGPHQGDPRPALG